MSDTPITNARWKAEWERAKTDPRSSPAQGMADLAEEFERDLCTTRQQLLAAQVEVKRLRDALTEISSPTQADNLLWWQTLARRALATPPDLSALSLFAAQKKREVLEKILEPIEGGYYQVIGEVKDALNVMLAELDQAPQGEKP